MASMRIGPIHLAAGGSGIDGHALYTIVESIFHLATRAVAFSLMT